MTEGLKWTVNEVPKSDDKHLELMSEENVKKANEFHRSFPQYSVTPLQNLSSLAKYLGVKNIFCKDESYRFGLNAFKVLGGSYAMGRYIAKELGRDISELPYNVLSSDKLREEFGQATFFTATDGNHGRGVAWAANRLGQKAVVRMPKGTTKTRFDNIAKEGATVTIEEVNYDDCVRMAAAEAAKTEKDKALSLADNSKTEANNAFTNAKADIIRRYVYQQTTNNETVTKISETKPSSSTDYETLEPTNEVALAAYTLNDLGNSGDITNWNTNIATTKEVKVSEESTTSINQFEILASTLSQVTRKVESMVKGATDDLGTEGDKSDKNTAWGRHQQLVEALEAAQKTYNDAVKADPKGDHSSLLNSVKDAQEAVDTDLEKEVNKQGNNTLLYYQKEAEKAEATQTKFNEAVAVFNDATKYKAYTDRVAAILAKEGKAVDAAKDAYWDAMQELAIAEANVESINNLIADTMDPETLIADCDTQIALEKETLAIAEALIYNVNAGGASATEREAAYADLIENAEKKIEYWESKKELLQKMVEQYKSQLEASLNSGSAE